MNRLYLLSWYYQGTDGETDAREFFMKLQEGLQKGKKFPFDCPSQVGLVHCMVDEHWAVGVLVMRGTPGDDSLEQTGKLEQWFAGCDADFSGTDRTGLPANDLSVEGTLQKRYGSHYVCEQVFDPLALAAESPLNQDKPQSSPWDSLAPEQKTMAADLINLAGANPDERYQAYQALEQKHYQDEALLAALPVIEAALPADDLDKRIPLYCGLGFWLGGNIYTRPKGEELIKHAIQLAGQVALPHALLGTLLMGDSSNIYLEKGAGSSRQHPELSDDELDRLARGYHDRAQAELELAIRLDPKDPTPYYAFCKSRFLDFAQLKSQYIQGIRLDKTHSPEFGGSHYDFGMKAVNFKESRDALEAFVRAMIASPQEYGGGPGTLRPQGGLALTCWQEATQVFASCQGDAGKIDLLWQVVQPKTAEPSKTAQPSLPVVNKPAPAAPPQTLPSVPAPAPMPPQTPQQRPARPALWAPLFGILFVCLGLTILFSVQSSLATSAAGVMVQATLKSYPTLAEARPTRAPKLAPTTARPLAPTETKPSPTVAAALPGSKAPTSLPGETYLSIFQPQSVALGYGTYSVGRFEFSSEDPADHITLGDPMVLHGIEYPHGIYAHAPSRLAYFVAGRRYQKFIATIGLIDHIDCGDGATFVVLFNSKEVYRSETLNARSAPLDIQVPIDGEGALFLVVESGPNANNGCDWAIWGDPRLR